MTARELYEYILVELNKLEAPSLLLEDLNYFINKAVQQYINLVYAKAELDQQSTDDIRVLRSAMSLVPQKLSSDSSLSPIYGDGLLKSSYYVDLPSDYMHLLSCIVEYSVDESKFKCYKGESPLYYAAKRLTPELASQIINNAYLKPAYNRPYYYINNFNTTQSSVTNPDTDTSILDYNNGDADKGSIGNHGTNWDNTNEKYIQPNLVKMEDAPGGRLANPSNVRLELRVGSDERYTPTSVYIDYIKAPMHIKLTHEQLNSTLDYSQVLEFPDYVCFEIINILTGLLMENFSDTRLQTNVTINKTISNPLAQGIQK